MKNAILLISLLASTGCNAEISDNVRPGMTVIVCLKSSTVDNGSVSNDRMMLIDPSDESIHKFSGPFRATVLEKVGYEDFKHIDGEPRTTWRVRGEDGNVSGFVTDVNTDTYALIPVTPQ